VAASTASDQFPPPLESGSVQKNRLRLGRIRHGHGHGLLRFQDIRQDIGDIDIVVDNHDVQTIQFDPNTVIDVPVGILARDQGAHGPGDGHDGANTMRTVDP